MICMIDFPTIYLYSSLSVYIDTSRYFIQISSLRLLDYCSKLIVKFCCSGG